MHLCTQNLSCFFGAQPTVYGIWCTIKGTHVEYKLCFLSWWNRNWAPENLQPFLMPYSIFGEIAVFCMRLLQGVSNQMVFLNQHKNGRQRRKCTLKWRVAVQPKMCPTPWSSGEGRWPTTWWPTRWKIIKAGEWSIATPKILNSNPVFSVKFFFSSTSVIAECSATKMEALVHSQDLRHRRGRDGQVEA